MREQAKEVTERVKTLVCAKKNISMWKTCDKSCSWYLVNGHEEGERERSVGVCSVGKNVEIVEIALGDVGRHRERVGTVG